MSKKFNQNVRQNKEYEKNKKIIQAYRGHYKKG